MAYACLLAPASRMATTTTTTLGAVELERRLTRKATGQQPPRPNVIARFRLESSGLRVE